MLGEIEWIEVFQPTEKIAIFLIFRPTQMDFVRVRNESDIDKKKRNGSLKSWLTTVKYKYLERSLGQEMIRSYNIKPEGDKKRIDNDSFVSEIQ